MTTLAEFVLARIADIEEAARAVLQDPQSSARRVLNARAWLAECEAKRRIVELHDGVHVCVGDRHGDRDAVYVAPGYQREHCPTLALLALPAAVHDDYDEEWRP